MPIYLRTAKDGTKSYQVKIRRKGSPTISTTFERKTDAQQWEKVMDGKIIQDMHFPFLKAQKTTVGELIDEYLAYLRMSNPRRWGEVQKHLSFWKIEAGHTMLASFRTEHVVAARKKLFQKPGRAKAMDALKTLSPATINRYTASLAAAIQYGVTPLQWIRDNPVSALTKLEEPDGRTRFLSEAEIDRLLAACRDSGNEYLFTIVLLGISTGARKSELQTLKWSQITDDNQMAILGKTKNGKTRACQLTGPVQQLLANLREARKDQTFLFPSPTERDRPIDFRSAWYCALRAAEVSDFRFHDLRHTCASYLAMNGVGEIALAEILGHKDLQMVRRYAHLAPGHISKLLNDMTTKVLGHIEIGGENI